MPLKTNKLPTPFIYLNAVLKELVDQTSLALENNLVGIYLVGSFATGDFDLHSDVDFLTVVNEPLCSAELERLEAVHQDIYELNSSWAKHLEGSYIPLARLQNFSPPTQRFPYLDNGSRDLILSDHDDSMIVYWVLREKGISLKGPSPKSIISMVPASSMKQEVLQTMKIWGDQLVSDVNMMGSKWYQSFVVISYCRSRSQSMQVTTQSPKYPDISSRFRKDMIPCLT